MASSEMLSTALAVAKALQVTPQPLTVNGVRYDGTEAVDISVGSVPIVSSVAEMTDTSKEYVLEETGTIWRYRLDGGYVDVLKTAEKEVDDGFPYNVSPDGTLMSNGGVGWRKNARVNGSGVELDEVTRVDLTGLIPVKKGQTVYLKGVTVAAYQSGLHANAMIAYNAEKKYIGFVGYDTNWTPQQDSVGVYSFVISDYYGNTSIPGVAYVRFQLREITSEAVISLDQYPEGGEMGYRWVDTGIPAGDANQTVLRNMEARTAALERDSEITKTRVTTLERTADSALPSWWTDYLPARMDAIRAHQDEGGRDAFSFAVMTDIHESGSLGRRTGAVARVVMDGCGMKYALDLGDTSTRASVDTRADMEASMKEAAAILAPIGEGLLRAQGNHDGAWGNDGGTYVHNFSEDEMYNRLFRPVARCQDPVFDTHGVGYYVDDLSHRARFVVLNTHHTDGARNFFNHHRYGQSQFDLLVKALTSLPGEDWCILLFSHVPPVRGVDFDEDGVEEKDLSGDVVEQELLRELVTAFRERQQSFSGSYGAEGAWDAVRLSDIDFSQAKGAVVAYFAGHLHGDAVYGPDENYPFPVITVRCDTPAEHFASQKAETREAGTCTEHSFDAVTVVRSASGFTVYLDKIGAGSDRVVRVAV